MNKETKEYIDEAAKAGAWEVLRTQRRQKTTNLYRATERLLRSYPKLKRMSEHPEEYGFLPVAKSKDISVAPPPGSGVRDPMDAIDEHVDNRAASYDRTVARFTEIDAVVREFEKRHEFIVIRMLYFNEDEYGHERDENTRRWTFESMADALQNVGVYQNEKTLRLWRTRLVQDMTVLLFGTDGAVSIESRDRPEDAQ